MTRTVVSGDLGPGVREPARVDLLSVDEARAFLLEPTRPITDIEEVDTANALGRVLGHDLYATLDVPATDNSAMDGYAVWCGEHGLEAGSRLPVSQRVAAGDRAAPLAPGTAARIFTGAPLPPGADAVVMQEDCALEPGGMIRIDCAVHAGQHVRRAGSDIAAGTRVLAGGTRLRPPELGIAASIGLARVAVVRRLRVALLSTGNELLTPGEPPRPGARYDSNHFVLSGLLQGLGAEIVDGGVINDSAEVTRVALALAAHRADLILSSGGVSVGEEDHVRNAVARLGEIALWRVAVKPGKPIAFGRVGRTPFIGLPGNPVSALVTFCLFVRPYVLRMQGVVDVEPRSFPAAADFNWAGGPREEYLRARLRAGRDGAPRAEIYQDQGSGVLTSAAWAEALVRIPAGRSVARGDLVQFLPFSDLFH